MTCTLCASDDQVFYHRDKKREYWRCQNCQLVYVPPQWHLSSEDEKAEYDQHENNADDAGYRSFLNRCLEPLLIRQTLGAEGLDFGCGPGPTVSVMAAEQGFTIHNYDLYYDNQISRLERQYDFIVSTEVIEHLSQPMEVLRRLDTCLKAGGTLAIMTKRLKGLEAFKTWHYKNDPTHIAFFSESSFEFIARSFTWKVEFVDSDVTFFTKPAP